MALLGCRSTNIAQGSVTLFEDSTLNVALNELKSHKHAPCGIVQDWLKGYMRFFTPQGVWIETSSATKVMNVRSRSEISLNALW